ncbi:MAG: hypothetical protein AB1505_15440 [Candidatus Latescibacterota bacterium]
MKRLLAVAAACALGLAAYVQAQPGGGGMGQGRFGGAAGGGMAMMGVESDWALVCFELGVDDATMARLRPVFRQAWDARQDLVESAHAGAGDRTRMREEMAQIQEELEQGYRAILSADQLKQLAALKAQRAASWRQAAPRGGMGPGGDR